MTKHTILVGLPRTGTTWVYDYIRYYFENNYHGMVLPKVIKTAKTAAQKKENPALWDDENYFWSLGDEWLDHKGSSDKEKIELLEACRKCGLELCHKVFANSLVRRIDYRYENTDMLNWFKDFYRDTDVIILRRKNLWKTYISYLFHFTISEHLKEKEEQLIHPWHAKFNTYTNTFERPNNEADILDETIKTNNIEFTHNEKTWDRFLWNIRFLNNHVINELPNAELIWTEDLSDKILTERFGGTPEEITKPFENMDYEKYYSKKRLELMKEKYYKIFRNEFIKHGYTSGI